MKMEECLGELASMLKDELVVVGFTGVDKIWRNLRVDSGADISPHAMGCFTPLGLGLALAVPERRVLVLDTDGSLLLYPSVLTTIGHENPSNLTVIVFDNECYQANFKAFHPTATGRGADLDAMAKASGIKHTRTVRSLAEFRKTLKLAVGGPMYFIVAKVERAEEADLARSTVDGKEGKYRFIRHLEKTLGRSILKPPVV